MLYYFGQYLFALVASGNLAPDLFIFLIYFLGFIKLNQFYDQHNGISLKSYLGIFVHRFFKLAPLYYFVFVAGWFVIPLVSTSGNWFASERLFWNCEAQWYYVVTFLNTLATFTKALEG